MILQNKIYRLGTDKSHVALTTVRVDEKIDGSQITFGKFDGKLRIRSKGRDMSNDDPNGMFGPGLKAIRAVQDCLPDGWSFHGEYLQRPKHNVLAYERVPRNHIVIFDAVSPDAVYVLPGFISALCEDIGAFEPIRYATGVPLEEVHAGFFETSQLGGVPEGVVIKGYNDGYICAKLVSEQFSEVKQDRTTRTRPNAAHELSVALANKYCPPARYLKAIQRLKEAGTWTGRMHDIGPLRKVVAADLEEECGQEIREELYKAHKKQLLRDALDPLTAWYEQYLINDNAYWSNQRGE